MLAKVGIVAKIENVEWAQWLSRPLQGQLRPHDHQPRRAAGLRHRVRRPEVLLRLRQRRSSAPSSPRWPPPPTRRRRARLWGQIQRQLAEDAVNAWVWNPAQVAVFEEGPEAACGTARPIFANDMANVSWVAAKLDAADEPAPRSRSFYGAFARLDDATMQATATPKDAHLRRRGLLAEAAGKRDWPACGACCATATTRQGPGRTCGSSR